MLRISSSILLFWSCYTSYFCLINSLPSAWTITAIRLNQIAEPTFWPLLQSNLIWSCTLMCSLLWLLMNPEPCQWLLPCRLDRELKMWLYNLHFPTHHVNCGSMIDLSTTTDETGKHFLKVKVNETPRRGARNGGKSLTYPLYKIYLVNRSTSGQVIRN